MTNAIIINDRVFISKIPEPNTIHCKICDLNKHDCKAACVIFGKNYIMKEIKDFTYTRKADMDLYLHNSSTGE